MNTARGGHFRDLNSQYEKLEVAKKSFFARNRGTGDGKAVVGFNLGGRASHVQIATAFRILFCNFMEPRRIVTNPILHRSLV